MERRKKDNLRRFKIKQLILLGIISENDNENKLLINHFVGGNHDVDNNNNNNNNNNSDNKKHMKTDKLLTLLRRLQDKYMLWHRKVED